MGENQIQIHPVVHGQTNTLEHIFLNYFDLHVANSWKGKNIRKEILLLCANFCTLDKTQK